ERLRVEGPGLGSGRYHQLLLDPDQLDHDHELPVGAGEALRDLVPLRQSMEVITLLAVPPGVRPVGVAEVDAAHDLEPLPEAAGKLALLLEAEVGRGDDQRALDQAA
ncbi:MAG: hypothetical protein C4306_09110, partial [Thermoleophilia bacterium]